MKHILINVSLFAVVIVQSGCGAACGRILTVPQQRVGIVAASPIDYTIRVSPDGEPPIDTNVPINGKVVFEVPVKSRDGYFIFLGIRVYRYPHPETFRIIRVLRDGRTIRRMSAQDIQRLPIDGEGYHMLKISK